MKEASPLRRSWPQAPLNPSLPTHMGHRCSRPSGWNRAEPWRRGAQMGNKLGPVREGLWRESWIQASVELFLLGSIWSCLQHIPRASLPSAGPARGPRDRGRVLRSGSQRPFRSMLANWERQFIKSMIQYCLCFIINSNHLFGLRISSLCPTCQGNHLNCIKCVNGVFCPSWGQRRGVFRVNG